MIERYAYNNYRYEYDTDKEMLILKMVDVAGKGRGLIE